MVIERSDLKTLYGSGYVDIFDSTRSMFRLTRLIELLQLKKTDAVVDFACGSGLLTSLVSGSVASYIGVDFSDAFIDVARKKLAQTSITNAQYACSDIYDFCLNHTNSYDVAFAFDFSEHVYSEEWLKILRGIKASLKPRGKLYLHTSNGNFIIKKINSHNLLIKQFPEHVAVRTPGRNCELLIEAGFCIDNISLLPHYNLLRWFDFLASVPIVGKYLKARMFIRPKRRLKPPSLDG